jgi:hypothetical protein
VKYDPTVPPDPDAWLQLDEAERIEAVLRYHKRVGIRVGSRRAHAAFHTIVENQIAEGLRSTCDAMDRLQQEGLDRHDAIHAVGSVLAGHIHGALAGKREVDQQEYDEELDALTAAAWLDS